MIRKKKRKKKSPSYKRYKREYKKQKEKLQNRGLDMSSPLLTKQEYEELFKATKAELHLQVLEGDRKAIGNVLQYIVRSQAYVLSQKQGKKLQEAYTKFLEDKALEEGKPITGIAKIAQMKIRTGAIDFDFLKAYRKKRLQEIISEAEKNGIKIDKDFMKKANKRISLEIGNEYFGGSPA